MSPPIIKTPSQAEKCRTTYCPAFCHVEAAFLWGSLLGRTCLNPPVLSVIMRIVSGAWIFVREDFCYICCTLQVIIVTYLFRLLAPADHYATVAKAIGFSCLPIHASPLGQKSPILAEFKGRIEFLSTHDLPCRKFAAVCPEKLNFLLPCYFLNPRR